MWNEERMCHSLVKSQNKMVRHGRKMFCRDQRCRGHGVNKVQAPWKWTWVWLAVKWLFYSTELPSYRYLSVTGGAFCRCWKKQTFNQLREWPHWDVLSSQKWQTKAFLPICCCSATKWCTKLRIITLHPTFLICDNQKNYADKQCAQGQRPWVDYLRGRC